MGIKKGRQEEKRFLTDNQEVNEPPFKTHSSNEGYIVNFMLSKNILSPMQKSKRILLGETVCFSSLSILGRDIYNIILKLSTLGTSI